MTQATSVSSPHATTPLRIVVTGGSGNIGTAVVRELLSRGHEVVILDRKAPRVKDVRFVYADLRDRHVVQPAIEGAHAVIHLGEIPSEGAGISPQDVFATNVAAGSVVLQTAADLGVGRVIYTSTCQVYGMWGWADRQFYPPKFPMDESLPLNPRNAYSLGKVANEGYCRLMADRHGLSVAVMRLPLVIDGGRWMKQIVLWSKDPEWYIDHHDGLWTFIHIEDVASCYAKAVEVEHHVAGVEAYNLFADDILGVEPLRQRLAGLACPELPPLPDDWPERAAPVDTSKARNRFGWAPRHTYTSMLATFNAAKKKL